MQAVQQPRYNDKSRHDSPTRSAATFGCGGAKPFQSVQSPSLGRIPALRTEPDSPARRGCMVRPLKVAVQMDPIDSINIDADSTFALMLEAQARGHALWHYEVRHMALKEGVSGPGSGGREERL